MKLRYLLILLLLFPFNIFAFECTNDGYSIIFVNGILTSKEEARQNRKDLEDNIANSDINESFKVLLGHNETHLAGAGDWIKSIQQAYVGKEDIPIDDYDLRSILLQIHSEVKTKKILLVGHSQGTFYTNALYEYLTKNGVSKESIKVYNLATPASFVAGDLENKRYLTSSNDRLITEVRKLAILGGANPPLDANDTLRSLDDNGHGFSSTYLAGAPVKIVSTIENALSSLSASPTASSECFAAPPENLAYKAQKLAFAVADPISEKTWQAGVTGYSNVQYVIGGISNTLASVAQSVVGILAGSEPAAAVIVATEGSPKVEETFVVQTQTIAPVIEASVIEVTEPIIVPLPVLPPVEESSTAAEFAPTTEFLEPKFIGGFQPGFGGGGVPSPPASPEPEPEPEPVAVPPASPVITSPTDTAYFATTTIVFTGTAPSGAIISTDFSSATTSADGGGNWSISLSGFPEGAATVNFYATDATGLVSSPSAISFSIDTVAPSATTLSIAECALSLTTSVCTVAAGTVNLSWILTDADYYGISDNGTLLSTTTLLTSSFAAATGAHSFEVTSYDFAGNSATSSPATTTAITLPSIGYYCDPYTSTYLEGGTYAHTGMECHYMTQIIGDKTGAVYKGALGNATVVNAHGYGAPSDSIQQNDVDPSAVPGDRYFTVIYELRVGPAFQFDSTLFRSFFKEGTNPPPHLNFGIINWVYGP